MEKARDDLIDTQIDIKALNFIRRKFDSDTEDQSDTLPEYLGRTDCLQRRGEEMGLATSIQQVLD